MPCHTIMSLTQSSRSCTAMSRVLIRSPWVKLTCAMRSPDPIGTQALVRSVVLGSITRPSMDTRSRFGKDSLMCVTEKKTDIVSEETYTTNGTKMSFFVCFWVFGTISQALKRITIPG